MKNTIIVIVTTSLLLLSFSAWSASTKEEIIELKAQVAEMQKDLQEIKKLLKEGARAPTQAAGFKEQVVSIGDSPFKGKVDAPVTIIEYSDYDCPFCARHYRDVMPILQEKYIDTGKIKFVMRENPIATLHKDATNAAKAAVCAGDQGKYWEMHDMLFENQKKLQLDNLKSFAGTIGLDLGAFDECLESNEAERRVRRDIASASKLGMRGTPGFVVGLTDVKDPNKANMKVYIKGAQSINNFQASIDDLLESAE